MADTPERKSRRRRTKEIEIIPKVSPDHLDLVPYHDPDTRDRGWSSEEIQATSKILAGLLGQSGLTDLYPMMVAEVRRPLEIQLAAALDREERENAEARAMNRRDFLRRAFWSTVGGTATVAAGIQFGPQALEYLKEYYSPEAIAAREEAEKARKELLERRMTLGLNPSVYSQKNWSVRYPPLEVRYPPLENGVNFVKADNDTHLVNATGQITFPGTFLFRTETDIFLEDYERVDGVLVPMLRVATNSTSRDERWVLRDQPAEGLDHRVVVLDHIEPGHTKYLSISRINTVPASFKVEVMKRVPS